MQDVLPTVALIGVMTGAAVSDLRSRRIPNRLVVTGLTIGLLVRAFGGWAAFADGLLGAAAGLTLGLLLFTLDAMRGGDGKLMAVVGAFLGLERGLLALGAGAVAAGLLAMVLAVRRGVILPVLLRTRDLGIWLITFGRHGERPTLGDPGAIAFPFGAALAVGAMAVGLDFLSW